MLGTTRRCGLIAMAGILISASLVAAAPPLADRLPADATVYFGWAGSNDALNGSLFGELMAELPLDEIMAAINQGVDQKVGDPQTRDLAGAVIGVISLAANHPGAVCVTTIPVDTGGAEPLPDMALLIDLGSDRQAFDAHLAVLLAAIGDEVVWTDVKTASATYKTARIDREIPSLSLGYIGDTLFVSLGADMPGKLIALRNGEGDSLLTAEGFTAAYGQVSGDAEQSVTYLDIPALLAMVNRIVQETGEMPTPSIPQIVDAIGLGKATALVSTTRIVDRKLYTKTRLLSTTPHQGLLMLMAGEPMTLADMAVAPADADLLLTCSLDPLALWNEALRVISTLDPQAGSKVQSGVAMLGTQLGLSIDSDLLAHMGDQFTLVSAPSLGGLATGTALVIELKNEEAFSATLSRLEAMGRGILAATKAGRSDGYGRPKTPSMYTSAVGDATMTYLQIPMAPVVAPTWAIADGKLIIALWPQVVRAMVAGRAVAGLDTDPQFAEALAGFSGAPTMLSYVNEPALARLAYGLPMIGWTSMATMLGAEGIPARADWLPDMSALMRCVRPSIGIATADAGGITTEDYKALPFSVLDSANIASSMAVSTLLPALGRSRQLARQAVSMANLRAIGQASAVYQLEHHDAMPPNLQALVDASLLVDKHLISPTSGRPYVYIRLSSGASDRLIMAYEEPMGRRGERVPVLFRGTHVEMRLVDAEFYELIEESKAAAGNP